MYNKHFCYRPKSECFACISHASSCLMVSTQSSCDRLDDGHMIGVVHRRWGGAGTPGRGSWSPPDRQ